MDPVALVCSVELESAPLVRHLGRSETTDVAHTRLRTGLIGERRVVVLETGMGKTNSGHAMTLLLERQRVSSVISFGVAGAYAGSGLRVGDIAFADREIYGDEGIETPGGWASCEEIGIPLLERNGVRYFNAFEADQNLRARAEAALRVAGRPFVSGTFVTVSACSGTARRGAELSSRHQAICETMEGAAVAHVCAMYGVPFLELRGVSNLVEDRDRSRWDLEGAARAAADALLLLGSKL